MPRSIRQFAVAIVLTAGLAACGESSAPAGGPGGGQMPPPVVSAEKVEPRAVDLSVTLPGRVTASRIAEVRPQVSGLIEERLFTEGAEVEAGAPLFQIDRATYAAGVQRAEAQLAQAKAAARTAAARGERYAKLVERGGVSRQEYDDALAGADQAAAQVQLAAAALEQARIDLDRTTISAPISGHIGRVLVTEGALVSQGQSNPLAVITQLDPVYVDLERSSADVLKWRKRLAAGDFDQSGGSLPVTLILEDGTTYEHEGKLALTEVNVDPQSGSVTLRAVVPNPDGLLLPGMFVRARLSEGTDPDAILVPQAAVSRTPDGAASVVVVESEGRTRAQTVVAERTVGNEWLVDGLAPGTAVVTAGFQRFRPGDVVTVETPRAASAAGTAASSAH